MPVAQLNKFSDLYGIETPLAYSREITTGPNPEPAQSNFCHRFLPNIFNIISSLLLCHPSCLSAFGFPTKRVYPFLFYQIRATYHAIFHQFIGVIAYLAKLQVMKHFCTYSLFGSFRPSVLSNTFPNIVGPCCSLKVRDQH